ncbi:L-seryl-tRNA(Sec) selenium transferase [Micromonospora sp. NPDC049559]|uniref:L-seryl-tRNA(Sec) selenium transferase n=1 Tax=Micromonospora sp. NPDC049559 TaxID=3155923 RepID=UPI003432E29B
MGAARTERGGGDHGGAHAPADVRRRVPRTDAVLADPRLVEAAARLGRGTVKAAVVAAQERARRGELAPEEVPDAALAGLPERPGSLRAVLNATGVVLHTNLGRAPLSAAALDALTVAAGVTDLEFDLATGRRARRGRGLLAALARAVPAAEAVHVVNNGAAALVLAATALAAGREIVVSRGELVEIGDSFRLPDLIESTGARLREVGTTNRTTLADYAAALGPATGFVLKVHPSNFVVRGFTSAASVAELATLDVPVVVDIGSGLLAPEPVLPDEPDAASALADGAALVTASGDKLLGGPQAGLLLGRAELVERLRRHPLARALRVDKLTVAALEATLTGPPTPTTLALRADADRLRERAERLAGRLRESGLAATARRSESVVGGGGAPGVVLPSAAVALPTAYVVPLRTGSPAVVGRVEQGELLLDLRCVPPEADDALYAAVRRVAAGLEGGAGLEGRAGSGSSAAAGAGS